MTATVERLVCAGMLLLTACSRAHNEAPAGSPSAGALTASPAVDHLDAPAREPMIVRARDGALLVSGYGSERPVLWRSTDDGATWRRVDVGTKDSGAIGNSDVDLAVAPDGTLYFIVMTYDRTKFEGVGIRIASSLDNGATWKWSGVSHDRFDDRPWIEVAPNGTAHAIWNDGAGVSHVVSSDRGTTWRELPRVHPRGGSSHMAIGPNGTIAVRVTPLSASANRFDAGMDSLAVSTDGGVRWTMRGLPGTRAWRAFDPNEDLLRWVEPIAWDSTGALYSFWSEGKTMWLARSADSGVSWQSWKVVDDTVPVYFPYLSSRGTGELAATWYSGLDTAIVVNVARFSVREGNGDPVVRRAAPFAIPSFVRDTSAAPNRDTAGEYVPVLFLGDGGTAVVTTIQDRKQQRFGFTFRPFH